MRLMFPFPMTFQLPVLNMCNSVIQFNTFDIEILYHCRTISCWDEEEESCVLIYAHVNVSVTRKCSRFFLFAGHEGHELLNFYSFARYFFIENFSRMLLNYSILVAMEFFFGNLIEMEVWRRKLIWMLSRGKFVSSVGRLQLFCYIIEYKWLKWKFFVGLEEIKCGKFSDRWG